MLTTVIASTAYSQELASVTGQPAAATRLLLQDARETKSLKDVLVELEQQYKVTIVAESELLQDKLVEKDQSHYNEGAGMVYLEEQLHHILQPMGLTYRRYGNSFVIKPANAERYVIKKVKRSRVDDQVNHINGSDKDYKPLRVNPLVSDVVEKTITGQVTDLSTEEGLPGVNIVVKNTTIGTVTDIDGNYRLTAPDDAATLVFSSVGYTSEEVAIGNQTVIDLQMAPDIQSLSEVVVVGYGTTKRKDITGSLSSVASEELEKTVSPSVDQALQGRSPGLFVANSSGGAPGAAPTVRIRGSNSLNSSNSPLYVIDGFPVYPNNGAIRGGGSFRTDQLSPNTSNILATINPNDIASIEVLKDASATAIYGARGANGVIVITTKRGKSQAGNLNVDWYSGVSTITQKFPTMNAIQYSQLVNDFNEAFDVPPTFTEEQLSTIRQEGGTDWQDQIFRNALIHNFQLSSNGGNEHTQYFLSAGYYDEEGIIRGNDLRRFSLRANLDIAPTKKLNIGNSFTTSYTLEKAVPNGGRDPNAGPGVVFGALQFPPTDPVFNDDGSYFLFPSRSNGAFANPVAIVETQDIDYKSLRSLGTFFVDYEFIPGLTGKINLGYDLLSRNESAYYPRTTLLGSEVGGQARKINILDVTWMTDFLLSYNKNFGKHQISAVTGFTAQANTLDRTLSGRSNFLTDGFGTTNLSGGAVEVIPQSSLDRWSLLSWLGRVNYIFLDRYLFTFSGRYDGSSRFGDNNKFAFFPSGAFAWRLSNEPFMQNLAAINDLKLRASYGVTGNQEIGLYRSLPRYETVNEIFGTIPAVGVRPASDGIPNPDLTWEQTSQLDIGFDLSAYNNRLNVTVDYYNKITEDLILNFPVAVESGYSNVLRNSGSIQNEGIELSIGTALKMGEVGISLDANFTYNDNTILDLGGRDTLIAGESGYANIIGQDIGSIFVVDFAGIWQLGEEAEAAEYGREPGDPKFVDKNEDGSYDLNNDRSVIGVSQPTTFYGLSTKFDYKNVELSVFFQGSAGNLIRGGTANGGFGGQSNSYVSALNHWTPTNPTNSVPAFTSQDPLLNGNTVPSSIAFERADYLRLRNVTLAYTFQSTSLEKIGLSKLRVYFSGQNLLTFTQYTGQDPEIIGQFQGIYPFTRNFRVGINFGL